jgi:hypothetical protein
LALFRLMTNSTLVTCCTGKIGRLLAFEDAAGIDPGLSPPVGVICTIAHKSSRHGGAQLDRRAAGRTSLLGQPGLV